MRVGRGGIVEALVETFVPVDARFLEPGPGGELLAARLRLVGLWLALAWTQFTVTEPALRHAALVTAGVGLLLALVAYVAVTRVAWAELGFVLVTLDVALAAALVLAPVPGRNAALALGVLVLLLAGLRDDARLVALAGVLAAALVAWVGTLGDAVALAAGAALLGLIVARGRRLHPLSANDALTGLMKRAAFEDWLRGEAERSRRHGHVFTLALLEVDGFEHIAAAQGRARANAVLRSVSTGLRAGVRVTDRVARHGPGSFAVAFLEAPPEVTRGRVEALRERMQAQSRGGADQPGELGVTVSAGLAAWPADAEDTADLLALAAERLREARRAGTRQPVATTA